MPTKTKSVLDGQTARGSERDRSEVRRKWPPRAARSARDHWRYDCGGEPNELKLLSFTGSWVAFLAKMPGGNLANATKPDTCIRQCRDRDCRLWKPFRTGDSQTACTIGPCAPIVKGIQPQPWWWEPHACAGSNRTATSISASMMRRMQYMRRQLHEDTKTSRASLLVCAEFVNVDECPVLMLFFRSFMVSERCNVAGMTTLASV
jgi:hypothetical protein